MKEIKKIVFRKNLKNHIKFLLFKKRKNINPMFDCKSPKFLDTLDNKKINSEIFLMKSKFDYYLDKLKNENIFQRDYSKFNNHSMNNIDNTNKKNNNNKIKNFSLPDIFNSSKLKLEENKNKNKIYILKRPKLSLTTKNKIVNLKYNINYNNLNISKNKSFNNIFKKINLTNERK